MGGPAIQNYTEAAKILRANLSPRQIDLERLERFAAGTQYEGLEDWFSSSDVPLWERAPCIVYKIVANAIRSNGELVLGVGHFPSITSNPGEDDSEAGGLDEEQSKKVDRALQDLFDRARLRAVAGQALDYAQAARSVATIVGVRDGKPFIELVRARWCDPTLDVSGKLTRLEIRYPYVSAPEKQTDGTWKLFVRLYRRVIDAQADTTYLPLPADVSGRDPKPEDWQVDKARTVEHKLGYCPVHWYAHMKECTTVANYDGVAIHETELDEIRGLDFTLSQRHRAALFAGNPQIIETGVEPGYNPSGTGRTAVVAATLQGGSPNGSNPVTGAYVDTSVKAARKMSPGIVWQYESKDVKVAYLTLPPGALEALDENAADLRNKICEGLSYAPIDSDNVKFAAAMSGKAIEQLRGRQFNHCDKLRDDFGTNWILPVVLLLLRVAISTDFKSKAVDAVRDILAKYVSDDTDAPMIFLRWPKGYLQPDPADDQIVVNAVTSAYTGGLITLRTAVEKLAPIFGYSNIDQVLEMLEAEKLKKQSDALANAQAMAKTAPALPPKPGEKPSDKKPAPAAGDDA